MKLHSLLLGQQASHAGYAQNQAQTHDDQISGVAGSGGVASLGQSTVGIGQGAVHVGGVHGSAFIQLQRDGLLGVVNIQNALELNVLAGSSGKVDAAALDGPPYRFILS